MERRRLLLITYAFPPVGGIMVQRVLSFAKHLPRHGFEVHVLTAANPATPVFDAGLLTQVPAEVRVHRAFTPEPPFYWRKKIWSRFAAPSGAQAGSTAGSGIRARLSESVKALLSPDVQVLWTPFALRRAAHIVRKHRIDTVLVTAPPFSLFLVGLGLKRRFPHLNLVSDFRDEWLRFMLTDFEFLAGEATRRKAVRIERETVENSDLVLAVTRSSLAQIRSRYPREPEAKFVFLANGYDPEAFRGFRNRPHGTGTMVVTHMGTTYRTSSPRFYLEAVDGLPAEVRSGMETRFIGRVSETETELFAGRNSKVTLVDFLPQAEALKRVEETDYLLLTMTNDFSLPGKLFEYLATGKPVLALSPPGGEVDRLLAETGGGACADHADGAAVRSMLLQAWERWRRGEAGVQPRWEVIRRYERPQLAETLAGHLRALR